MLKLTVQNDIFSPYLSSNFVSVAKTIFDGFFLKILDGFIVLKIKVMD